jgi:hypothetical protein
MQLKRTVILSCLVTLVIIIGQIALLTKAAAPDHYYLGYTTLAPTDVSVYFSAISQGQFGKLGFSDLYATQPHQPLLFIYAPYILAGQLTKNVASPVLGYLALRFLAACLLPLAVWFYVREFVDLKRQQIAFISVYLFMGIGYFGLIIGRLVPGLSQILTQCANRCIASNFWMPESANSLSLLTAPHFALAIAFLLLAFMFAGRIFTGKQSWRNWFGLIASTYTATFFHQYSFVVIAFVVLSFWISTLPKIDIKLAGKFLVSLVPIVVYFGWLYFSNPILRSWQGKTLQLSPPLPVYIFGYGWYVFFLLFVPYRQIMKHPKLRLLIFHTVIQFLLLYIPIAPQRRFSMGLFAPLGVLAAYGFIAFLNKFSKSKKKGIIVAALLIGMIDPIWFVGQNIFVAKIHATDEFHYLYVSKDEAAAFSYLRQQHLISATVLADARIGNLIPALTGMHTFIGHWAQTPQFNEKQAALNDFSKGTTLFKRFFLKANTITYIWHNRDLDMLLPSALYSTQQVFNNRTINLYKIIE